MEARVSNSTVRVAQSIIKTILTILMGIIYLYYYMYNINILIAIICITIIIPIIYINSLILR